jgi:hypothetical protein
MVLAWRSFTSYAFCMATSAVSRARKRGGDEWRRFLAGVAVTAAANLVAWVYAYGRLTQRVDDLGVQVQQLQTIVMRVAKLQ